MKRPIGFLTAAMLSLSVPGVLHAADFNLSSVGILDEILAVKALPAPGAPQNKWWSAFGSAHKAVTRAALAAVSQEKFPDIAAHAAVITDGGNDESGHVDASGKRVMSLNGGFVENMWFGRNTEKEGGVLPNYLQFKFEQAYLKLGLICHLTQDQGVPAHAANIKHGFSEPFEAYSAEGNDPEVKGIAEGDLPPYVYYQALQDETRQKLPSWVNPANGKPYWVAAAGAPPLGSDVTCGPWGKYGAGGSYAASPESSIYEEGSGTLITRSPEIRARQLSVSALATVNVLKAASKRLPPLVSNLTIGAGAIGAGKSITLNFTAMDNRSRSVEYQVLAYKDGGAAVKLAYGPMTLGNGLAGTPFASSIPTGDLPPGNYTLDVRLTDEDGNTTPDEVNTDAVKTNDTKAPLTIN